MAALAWTIHQSPVPTSGLRHTGFFVIAPESQIESEASFRILTSVGSIREKIARRIGLYEDDPAAANRSISWPVPEPSLPSRPRPVAQHRIAAAQVINVIQLPVMLQD